MKGSPWRGNQDKALVQPSNIRHPLCSRLQTRSWRHKTKAELVLGQKSHQPGQCCGHLSRRNIFPHNSGWRQLYWPWSDAYYPPPKFHPFPHHKQHRLSECSQGPFIHTSTRNHTGIFLKSQREEEVVSSSASEQKQTKKGSSSTIPLGAIVNMPATCAAQWPSGESKSGPSLAVLTTGIL